MTNKEYNEYKELGEMLDDADDENVAMRCELENTKSDLIVTLEKLVKYQEKHIAELMGDEGCCECCREF